MYTRFFSFAQMPFSIAPDPHYLFMSERHREALAHLLYGLNGGGGFVLLTGEIGAGKTTVCRLFLEQIPAHCNVAYIFNPKQTVIELLQAICDEFGIEVPREAGRELTVKNMIDPLNAFLLAAHAQDKNNVLIIDEAQNLSADVLEQLRLLTNLETNERKLLQIVLIGQPELRSMLAQPALEQLAQRVIARFHLGALSVEETAQYIGHRLTVAGMERASPFSARVMRRIHARARGVPRRINLLCDRALLGAYAGGRQEVTPRMVDQAAREVFDLAPPGLHAGAPRWRVAAGVLIVAGVVVGGAAREFKWTATSAMRSSAPAAMDAATIRAPGTVAGPAMTTDLASALRPAAGATNPSAASRPAGVRPTPPEVAPTIAAVAPTAVPVITPTAAPVLTPAAAPVVAPATAPGKEARDLSTAYRHLAQAWKLTLGPGEPCAAARKQDAYCFTGRQSLADIRQLDRPGILTLHDDADEKYYAVLVGLNQDTATLRIGDMTESVTVNALAHRWRGRFITLWRGPPEVSQLVGPGDRGPVTDWLATRLATVSHTSAPAPDVPFDAQMQMRVREFQVAQGLTPDGVVGPQTLMQLSSAADDPGPRLRSRPMAASAAAPGSSGTGAAPMRN